MNAAVSATGLDVELAGRLGGVTLSLSLHAAGEPIVVAGPNGAGKTTLLMSILGAFKPARGFVALDGVPLFDSDRGLDVPVERRQIGYLPQRYALFPHLDVLANVAYGVSARNRVERRRRAEQALEELGVGHLGTRRPRELSGGETQRVALARALAGEPRALLLDEPMAALDASVRRDVRRFLAERLRALAIPTVIVTHDRADAEAFGGEVLMIERGGVVQRGSLSALAASPGTDFIRQFVDRATPG
jgi:molybdate transport system ATP-binding protein